LGTYVAGQSSSPSAHSRFRKSWTDAGSYTITNNQLKVMIYDDNDGNDTADADAIYIIRIGD
jgi:hypothetical protein